MTLSSAGHSVADAARICHKKCWSRHPARSRSGAGVSIMIKLEATEVGEFWYRIESYVQRVAAALERRVGREQANEDVLHHLAIVLEMMMDGTAPSDAARCLDSSTKSEI